MIVAFILIEGTPETHWLSCECKALERNGQHFRNNLRPASPSSVSSIGLAKTPAINKQMANNKTKRIF
jgi:hypothetical protein